MLTDTRYSPYAKVSYLPSGAVTWKGGLWKDSADVCAKSTVRQLKRMFDGPDISHVVENFRICAGEADGVHDGTPFGDGDFYKWMEAAMYAAVFKQDEGLLKELDDYIDLIGRAQLPDGYLSTKQIIGERQENGISRQGDINDFEVYNMGHLFTSACLYKRLTGKEHFLSIAEKAAGYLKNLYEEAGQKGQVKTAVCPSHYMGLVELYRTTGKKEYLELAETALNLRDSVAEGMDDNQDRIRLRYHDRIMGHAVRANYLYAGVADLYAETGKEELLTMFHKVWDSLVQKKIYITGGCGALYNGVSPYGNFFADQKIHQAYGYEYQLPNITAYNETCASVGGVMWALRMFTIEPKACYMDLLERMMLNVNLAAVSLDGKRFFYENMLRRAKKLDYELVWPLERTEYITSYCCPPNLARLIAQSEEYAYSISGDTVWTGIYGNSSARMKLENGASFTLRQETEYPYDGTIRFTFEDVEADGTCKLNLRIPGWAESGRILMEETGKREVPISLSRDHAGTYLTILVEHPSDTAVTLFLHMPVRLTGANSMVEEDTNQAAVERGPLVYCMESADVDGETLDGIFVYPGMEFTTESYDMGGRCVKAVTGQFLTMEQDHGENGPLYHTLCKRSLKKRTIRMIPYFAWDNRGFGEMKIWLPLALGI